MSEIFSLTLPLYCSPKIISEFNKRFEIARIFYNAILADIKKRRQHYKKSENYKKAVEAWKRQDKKEAESFFNLAKIESGYYLRSASQYGKNNSIEQFAFFLRKSWIGLHLDAITCQTIAKRAMGAFLRLDNKLAKKVYFKKKDRDFIYSIEGKSATSSLRFDCENKSLVWGNKLRAPLHRQHHKDEIALKFFSQENFSQRIKYCRLKRYIHNGDWRYLVQLICYGNPIPKDKHEKGTGNVGFDLGTKDISVVSDDVIVQDYVICKKITNTKELNRKIRILQRKVDRQRRISNPGNYREDGTVIKGSCNWIKSNRQLKTEIKLSEIQRKQKIYREFELGRFVNFLRSLGDKCSFEDCSYKSWQKNFGTSIGWAAPGKLIEKIKNKFGEENCFEFDTKKTKFSQTCPRCFSVEKKSLSEEVHNCEKCKLVLPRDVASAILAYAVKKNYQIDKKKVNVILEKLLCG